MKNKILLDDKGMIVQPSDNHKLLDSKGRENRQPEYGSISQIALWLDKGTGDVMRNNEYREEEANILTIKDYLIKNKILLDDKGSVVVQPSDSQKNPRPQNNPEYGSISQIALWLDKMRYLNSNPDKLSTLRESRKVNIDRLTKDKKNGATEIMLKEIEMIKAKERENVGRPKKGKETFPEDIGQARDKAAETKDLPERIR